MNDSEPFPRPFRLVRKEDVMGASGVGIVAWGAMFPDGKVVIRWCAGEVRQTAVWDSLSDMMAVHGHDGRTMVEFPSVDERIGDLRKSGVQGFRSTRGH